MITKAYILDINSQSNKYYIRIPIFDKPGLSSDNSIFSSALFYATLSHEPTSKESYKVGDTVFVGFENNDLNKPIIIGKLYTPEEEPSPTGAIDVKSLTVYDKAILPANTTIGSVNFSNISNFFASINDTLNKAITVSSAEEIITDIENFNHILTESDTNVQRALDTIDDHRHDDDYPSKDFWDNITSAGRLFGGTITANSDGTVNVAAGGGLSKFDDVSVVGGSCDIQCSPTSINQGQGSRPNYVEWNAVSNLSLTDNAYNFIYYNRLTNSIKSTTDFYSVSFTQDFTLGRVYRTGTEVVIRLCGTNTWNFNKRVQLFGEEVFPIVAKKGSMILGSSELNINHNGGVLWTELVNRFTVSAFNSAGTDRFTYWYGSNANGFTAVPNNAVIDNLRYYNGTALTDLTVNRYGVHWVYVVHDSTVHVIYGTGNFTLAQAEAATAPSQIPGLLQSYATLIGRIIVQRGSTTILETASAFTTTFSSTATSIHNELAGRNDSDAHPISSITNLQTELNEKQTTITGAATTITSSNLTASRVLVSNSSGKVEVSSVTTTTLGYLDATSSIQTQLDTIPTSTEKENYDTAYSHTSLTNNPHSVTATQVGLGTTSTPTFAGLNVGTDTSTWSIDDITANVLTFKDGTNTRLEIKAGGLYVNGSATALGSGTVTEVTALSPISSSGGTTPQISVSSGFTIPTSTEKGYYDSAYSHISLTNNPHSVTATQVGLGTTSTPTFAGLNVGSGSTTWSIDDATSNTLSFKLASTEKVKFVSGDGIYFEGTKVGSGSVTSVTGTGAVSSTGGTTPQISIASGYVVPTTTEKGYYDSAYSHISLTNNPHSVTASQVGLGTTSTPTFAGINVGSGSSTWTINDTTANVLTFKDGANTRLEIKAGGLYVNGSTTPVGSGTVTSVTATGAITSSGGTTPEISVTSGYTVPTSIEKENYDTAYTGVNSATNINTVSTIVKRDSSGNFSAGTITANLTGTASENLTSSSTLDASKLSGAISVSVTQTEWDSAYTATNSATSSNTINTIVKRDGSGNFSAGSITGTALNVGTGSATWTIDDNIANVLTFKDGLNTRLEIKSGGLYVNGSSTALGSGTVTSVGATSPIASTGGTTPDISVASGFTIPTTTEKGNYDTAYGWGNHATVGYLTSLSTLDASKLSGTIPASVAQTEWDTAYSHTSLTNNPHSVTASQVGLGTASSPTFAGLNVGSGSSTWTINDITANVLTFKDGANTRLEIKSGGLYVNGSTTPLGEGSVTSVSLASGTNNGTLKLTVNGTATDNIAVKGLGSAAYTASTDYVAKNTSITGATKTKITYDAKGLVTSGADATLDDIADGTTRSLSNYVLTTRKVNGHELSSDVTVTASDVGLGTTSTPTFAGLNVGAGSSTWTIDDATVDELQFIYNGAGTAILPKVVSGTKTIAFTDNVPNVGSLNTNNATAQTVSSSESFTSNISLHKISKTGSYSDLLNKPTIPATNVIPVTTTANKMLVSTTTSGTAKWSDWSSAGFLKTDTSGVISVDTNTYLTSSSTLDATKLSGAISTSVTQTNWDTAYSHTSLTNNPHSVTASQVGLGTTSTPSFAGLSVGTGSTTWSIDDITSNTLSFKLSTVEKVKFVSGDGIYFEGTKVGSGSVTSVSGTSPIASTGGTTPTISIASGYTIPTSTEKGYYDTAYGWGNHALVGYLTASSTLNASKLSGTISDSVAQTEWDSAYAHTSLTNNPHSVTASQVGLGTTSTPTFAGINVGSGSSTWTINDITANVLTFKDGSNTRLEIKAGGLYVNGSSTALGSGTVTSVTGTSPIASTGGTTPVISVASGYTIPTSTEKGNYDTAYTAVNSATNSNTASTIVKRDGSGNFSAGSITANLTGTASGNLALSGGTLTGTVKAEDLMIVTRKFTMLENFSTQYILLCQNIANNDVNGHIRIDRTSGNYQAASLDVVVTSTQSSVVGGSILTHQYAQENENYDLVTLTYSGSSWVAIRYVGNSYPYTTANFTGILRSTNETNSFLTVEPSQVTSVALLTTTNSVIEINSNKIWHEGNITPLTATSTLDASKLSGTIPSAVLGNSTVYIGSTAVTLNRTTAPLALTGVTNTNWDSAYTATNNATSVNTASTIVKRGTSGEFSAGAITGTALNVGVGSSTWTIDDTTTNVLTFKDGANTRLEIKSGGLYVNGSTTALGSGTVTSVTATGAITSSGGTTPQISVTSGYTVPTTTEKGYYDTAYTGVNNATNANTASTIVKRDASGNFSAGTITASLTGTASGNLTSSSTLDATKLSGAIPIAVTQTEWDTAYSHTSLTNNPHSVTATQVGLGTASSPTFAGLSVGSGSATWTIDDTTVNVLTFKDGANTRLEIKSGGLYVNGSTTPVGSGTVTSVTGTGAIASSGGTTPQISIASGYTVPTSTEKGYYDSAYTATNTATNVNTVSTIVKRDSSGNFSAGTITANLTGTASGNLTSSSTLDASKLSGTIPASVIQTEWDTAYSHTSLTNNPHSVTATQVGLGTTSTPTFAGLSVGTGSNTWTIDDAVTNVLTFKDGANTRLEIKAGGLYVNGSTTALGSGTVTSVTGTSPVVSSGGTTPAISLATGYGDTLNPYASKTAKFFLAAPAGANGVPTFRAIAVSDIPTLNQSTTGSAGSVANSLVLKFDTGTTEGTSLYTYNGSGAKTIDFKGGTNVTLTETAGVVTFSSPSLGLGTTSGTGNAVTDISVSGHTITMTKGSTFLTGNQSITLSGDVTGSGTTAITTTLKNSGVTAGSYTAPTISVDAQGRITSASSNTIPTVNNGTLTLGVSGTGLSGSATFTANQSGNSTFTITSNATSANTASTIVSRGTSGEFSAGAVTATALNVGTGSNIWTIDDTTANVLTFKDGINTRLEIKSGGLYVNGSTTALGSGTVTSVTGTGAIASSGGSTPQISIASGYTVPTSTEKGYYDSAYTHSTTTTGSVHGSTTVGGNLLRLTNVTTSDKFLRINFSDNSVSALDAATFRTAIGAGTSSTTGTVTSVGGTGTVSGITLTGTVTTTGNLTLGGSISGLTTSNLSASAGIVNAQLANSSVTVGTTAISLGGSATTIAGLTSVTSTTFVGALTGTASGNLTSVSTLDASKLSGTIPSAVLGNSTHYIGTTAVTLNRASATLALTGVTNTNWDAAYTHVSATNNPHNVTATQVGLGTTATPTFAGISIGAGSATWTIDDSVLNVLTFKDGLNTRLEIKAGGLYVNGSSTALGSGTVTSVTATGAIASSGGSTPQISVASGYTVPTSTEKGYYDSAYTGVNTATNANTASTIVKRDASGNFSAGTITANLTGTASGNLTSSSTLDASKLSGTIPSAVLGNSTHYIGTTAVTLNRASASLALTGVTNTNWDSAYTHSTTTTGSVHGSTTVGGNLLRLTNVTTSDKFLRINFSDNSVSALDASAFRTAIGAGTSSTTGTVTSVGGTGTVSGITLTGTVTTTGNLTLGGSISGLTTSNLSASAGIVNAQLANSSITVGTTAISLGSSSTTLAGLTSVTSTVFTTGTGSQTWQVTDSGNNLLFQAGSTPATKATLFSDGALTLTGKLTATSKSFLIDHPTKEGYKLQHGSLEGPENGVYVRGRLKKQNIIQLPDYWRNLVDEETITVSLTAIGKPRSLFVEHIEANKVYINSDTMNNNDIDCFYVVYGERKDIDKLEVEMEAN